MEASTMEEKKKKFFVICIVNNKRKDVGGSPSRSWKYFPYETEPGARIPFDCNL